jgi:hypothetical protein
VWARDIGQRVVFETPEVKRAIPCVQREQIRLARLMCRTSISGGSAGSLPLRSTVDLRSDPASARPAP